MKATLTWVVDKRQRKDGTYPLRWRLQYNGERRYYQSDTIITENDINKRFEITDWDIEGRLYDDLRIFRRRLQELHLDVNLLDMDFVFTKVFGTVNPDRLEFVSWAREYVKREGVKRPSFVGRYTPAINALVRYKGAKIPVTDMTTKMMKGFEAYLTKNDLKRAPSLYTMCIKALFNNMRDEYNDYDNDDIIIKNTMASYKVPEPPMPEKRGLTIEQMRLILNSPSNTGNEKRDMARDVFVMSFHLLGINAVDLWQLQTWKKEQDKSVQRETNIHGYIAYERQKTRLRRKDKAYIEIDVPAEIVPLMLKYKAKSGKYVLRFRSQYKDHKNFNKALNEGLKMLAAEINGIDYMKLYYRSLRERKKINVLLEDEYHKVKEIIPHDLDYYTARHTMATIACNDCLIDQYTVDKMLNHSSQMLSRVYIRDNFRPINLANRKLLDYVYGQAEAKEPICKTIAI